MTGETSQLVSGATDRLNSMNLSLLGDNEKSYVPFWNDIDKDTVIAAGKISLNNRLLNPERFRALYKRDDPRFVFGRPEVFSRLI